MIGNWKLVHAPFVCRESILANIRFFFKEDGTVLMYNTANMSNGTFTVNDNVITINYNGFTQRGRLWMTSEERDEASLADKFLHKLIRKPFTYKLIDNELIVYHKDQEYKFVEMK